MGQNLCFATCPALRVRFPTASLFSAILGRMHKGPQAPIEYESRVDGQ